MKRFLTVLGSCILFANLLLPFQAVAQQEKTETLYSNDRVTAFRVRADYTIDLDEDSGWADTLNKAPDQAVDNPFRIRFEVESDTSFYRRQYSIQYRWNNQPWSFADAHEFPYESAKSPAVSIVSCQSFFLGEEAEDLISVSEKPSNPGAGISLSPVTPGWFPDPESGASAEWEIALVIRRWADGPQKVAHGDRFSIRMVDHLGHPLAGPTPQFSVKVPKGHIGGTFVETPARIGPYENSKGDLYFIMEPTETDNVFMMLKSTDGGESWFEADTGNRPDISDLEGVGSVISKNGVIHIVHQISEGVYYHAFATSDNTENKDRWVVNSRLIATHEEPPTQTADIAIRPDGSLVVLFAAGDNLKYSILEPGGEWSKAKSLNHPHPVGLTNPTLLSLPEGNLEIVYKSMDGKGWHRQMQPDNTLTSPVQFANDLGTKEDEMIAILPMVHLTEKKTTVAAFRQSDGYLYLSYKSDNNKWSEPIKASDRPVVTNAVDSEQAGADMTAWGEKVILSFIAEDDRDIYLTTINNFDQTPEFTKIISGIDGSWVRGNILYARKDSPVYGMVYDAGSEGGSGFNKFTSLNLAEFLENSGKEESQNTAIAKADVKSSKFTEFSITGNISENDSTLLRIAFIGDGEPKPCALFPHTDAAVDQINTLMQTQPVDFVIGIGDVAHKGTEIQYEAATEVFQKLEAPFYPIMGNEEHGSTIERYLHYARQWNSVIKSPRYVINHDKLAFVFASPDHGRDFDDSGAEWVLEQIQRLAPKPVFLIVHGAQKGVYSENPDKGISNQLFIDQVIEQANLAAVISGDLHMDMERVNHSKQIEHVHYLHIPALERTKIPDKTNHTPMFRVMTINRDGHVNVDTYATGEKEPREELNYSFTLDLSE